MELLETLKRKIESAEDLGSVVRTMKALAAASIREHERAVESLLEYHKTIEMGFHILIKNIPRGPAAAKPVKENRICAVIFGSERGMCGQFNEQIAYFAIDRMERLGIEKEERTVFALGDRVVARLEEAGERVEERFSIFGTHVDITTLAQEVLLRIEERRMKREIEQIVLFYNKPAARVSYRPAMVYLLPFEPEWFRSLAEKPWPSRTLPMFTMEWSRLFSSLTKQYLFFSLYRAFAESLASENTSRLSSMHVAEKNIEERLAELNAHYNRQRQESITSELLDIITGFEALADGKR